MLFEVIVAGGILLIIDADIDDGLLRLRPDEFQELSVFLLSTPSRDGIGEML